MIQRIQSVWLLLAAIFDAVTFRFPFFTGDWMKDALPAVIDLNARTTTGLTALSIADGALAFVTIFLFNNRKLQLKLTYLGLFLTALLITLYFLEMGHFSQGSIALWCIFHFGILASYILAARGILKDEKLIRSMDRLR